MFTTFAASAALAADLAASAALEADLVVILGFSTCFFFGLAVTLLDE
jgi:hypothetical protein